MGGENMGNDESRKERVYLDTSYLLELIKKRVTQKGGDAIPDVQRSITRAKKNYQIVIPQIVVGEFFAKLPERIEYQQNQLDFLNKFLDTLHEILGSNFDGLLPITRDAIIVLKDMMEYYDDRIEPTDMVIIAQAATDQFSKILLTLDSKILFSKGLRDFVEELQKNGKRTTPLEFRNAL